jgi:hypothetical protein
MRYQEKIFELKQVPLAWLAKRNAAYLSSHLMHRATVERYMLLTTPAPPILIAEGSRIIDGHHRVAVALEKGQTEILARIQPQPE